MSNQYYNTFLRNTIPDWEPLDALASLNDLVFPVIQNTSDGQ